MTARIEATANRAVARVAAQVATAARELPGISVERGAGSVTLVGRGLTQRVLTDARLRWIGGMLR